MFVTLSVDPALVINLTHLHSWMFDPGEGDEPDTLTVETSKRAWTFAGPEARAIVEVLEVAVTAYEDDQCDSAYQLRCIAGQLREARLEATADAEQLRRALHAVTSPFV